MNGDVSISRNIGKPLTSGLIARSEGSTEHSGANIKTTSNIQTGYELKLAELQGDRIPVGEEQLIKAIDRAVMALQGPNTTFEVSRHEKLNAITVKVLNKDTGELIREIPPEKTLDLVAKMMEIAGILIDEKI
ncbi:flagellar protein FlaG [Marinicrinis sediminis]|uniref:Flagellar protein FlaG n=1 Tax=Marinicrinis sediminis TaxID=1652465 RepID=A0ABW5RBI6_9BACL